MKWLLPHLNALPGAKVRKPLGAIFERLMADPPWKGGLYTPAASGAGLSPAIWSDCPRLLMLMDPLAGHFVGDDFTLSNGESYTTAKNYTLAGANGTFTHPAGDPDGVALLSTSTTAQNEANVNVNSGVGLLKAAATTTWWFETRVNLNQITTGQGAFVGLVDDQVTVGADFMTDTTMALKVQGLLGFQVISPVGSINANWQSVHVKASGARVALNATALAGSTGWNKFGLKCTTNGTVGLVTYYVNGVQDPTSVLTSAANFPLDLYMLPVWAVKTGDTTNNTLSVDWWYAAQLR